MTERKPRVKKTDPEVIGDFGAVLTAGDGEDGRGLYQVESDEPKLQELLDGECYIRAATAYQGGQALLQHLGVKLVKVSRDRFTELLLQEVRELRAGVMAD